MSRVVVFLLLLPSLAWPASRIFYDGFESGNTNLWSANGTRDRCTVRTSGFDGTTPYAGTYMASCNSNGPIEAADGSAPSAFETLQISTAGYTNELFIRIRVRRDIDHDVTSGSAKKLIRHWFWEGNAATYKDSFEVLWGDAMGYQCNSGTSACITYWGDAPDDNTGSSGSWHEVEGYYNSATGIVKRWHDGVLVKSETVSVTSNKWADFFLTSNWSDAHDAVNHLYFDEMEVFSDQGSGATGSMVDGTITIGGGDTTPPVISNPLPSGTQAIGTTNVTLQVTTNENATCKYGSSDAAYASLPSTFSTTGGTTHQQSLAVSAGSYTRYVRCQDGSGNANTSSTIITFTIPVLAPPTNFNVTVQ